MALDLDSLRAAITAHGPVMRVVIASVQGSAPREVGAAVLVWDNGQSGTIGGGALEYEATETARDMLRSDLPDMAMPRALGPDLGQCCGGRVVLWSERWDLARLDSVAGAVYARTLSGAPAPLTLKRLTAQARQGQIPAPQLTHGWFIEPVAQAQTPVWVWGAGHVGRAVVQTLAPLPELALTWVDTGADRFPGALPQGVTTIPTADPALLMQHAPHGAHHLILTYSHALDLALCDAALRRGFASAGVIGSDSKWARFAKRLRNAGHSDAQIARICCPIGHKALGKHPQAIAVGVATALLTNLAEWSKERENTA